MLTQLIEEYQQVFGHEDRYEVLRLFNINEHVVAWMRHTVSHKGQSYASHQLMCECDFTEGITWKRDEDGNPYRFIGNKRPAHCINRRAAVYMRHLELSQEYCEYFGELSFIPGLLNPEIFPELVLDLIEKVKKGEMVGDDSGAAGFWGGFFYTQTLAAITEAPHDAVMRELELMQKDHKIDLEGNVVREYREPPPPTWTEAYRVEENGFIGVAKCPANTKTPRHWLYDLYRSDGSAVFTDKKGADLMHPCFFGPDVEDALNAEYDIQQYIDKASQETS